MKKKCRYIGILANRSLSAYCGVLSTLKSEKVYVPLNPKFPEDRLSMILSIVGIDTVIADNDSFFRHRDLLLGRNIDIIAPELNAVDPRYMNFFDDKGEIEEIDPTVEEGTEGKAYLLFTSGSTGVPKGIEITHRNVYEYLRHMNELLKISNTDRCSQFFDLGFDLSVHDLFVTWMAGATLCIPDKNMLNPARYVEEYLITVWFSVPSVGYLLVSGNFLGNNFFPSLRISLFCGEPLVAPFVEKWETIAPNSRIENIYGPTEATIGISSYTWKKGGENKIMNGVVSIGKVFSKQEYIVVDDGDRVLGLGSIGELLLSGSQVITEYFSCQPTDLLKFLVIANANFPQYYRTGDIVFQDSEGYLFFLHRKDYEFKIRGYRVNEEEINHIIREVSGILNVITMPCKRTKDLLPIVISFIESVPKDIVADIITLCKKRLPHYMIPESIIFVEKFPLNGNGKIDRKSLLDLIGLS